MHLSLLSVSVFVAVISAIRIPSDPASFPLAADVLSISPRSPFPGPVPWDDKRVDRKALKIRAGMYIQYYCAV